MSFLYKPKCKHGDFIKFPQLFKQVLIVNGAGPTDGDKNDFRFQLKSKLYVLFGWIVLTIMAFMNFCGVAYLYANILDVLKAVEASCTFTIALFSLLRSLHFMLNTDKLKRLLIIFGKEIWIDGEKFPRRVEKCHRVMQPAFVYFIISLIVLCLYTVIPIFVFYNTNQIMASNDKRLPFLMILPYDVQKTLPYIATYICAIYTGWIIVSHSYAYDALLLFFVSYLCGQFEILHADILRGIPECHAEWQQHFGKNEIVCVNYDAGRMSYDGRIKRLQKMYTKRLHELSARHNKLIGFCVQLNDLISFPILINVINSTFLICFCGFQFLVFGTTSLRDFLHFSLFFLSVVLQLFVLCKSGSLLTSYSTETALYLYFCNWEGGQLSKDSPLLLQPEDMDAASLNTKLPSWKFIKYYPADKDFRKKLQFMIMRCHRSVEFNGMKFTILSLQGFTKILSSSMSYFALLKTFLDKQK